METNGLSQHAGRSENTRGPGLPGSRRCLSCPCGPPRSAPPLGLSSYWCSHPPTGSQLTDVSHRLPPSTLQPPHPRTKGGGWKPLSELPLMLEEPSHTARILPAEQEPETAGPDSRQHTPPVAVAAQDQILTSCPGEPGKEDQPPDLGSSDSRRPTNQPCRYIPLCVTSFFN